MNLNWIYTAISWLLLRWHELWGQVVPEDAVLGTNWSWVLAIVFLVITIRVILFPLFIKQIKSQRAMQALAPQLKELQNKYKNDRETLQREMVELYRKEKANPLMGCLPLLLQAPVFIGLLHVLRRINPDNVYEPNWTLYGWTTDQWFSALGSHVFGAPIWGTFTTSASQLAGTGSDPLTVKVVSGILVIVMTATTFLTTRQMILKTGWNPDPQQRMIQKVMLYGIPVMLLFSGVIFPIGVIVYWVINNAFSLGQQIWVLRKYPPPQNITGANLPAKKTAKPGSKKHAQELKEKQERAKALAPKVGAKPTNRKKGGATRGASK
ncbi:YidC/Oxa1 family membrane protein insertase [Stackebrandtia albiflava]|uniref:Membrane protein insertase YidC n=1 Tax=Stackebrandtia albiflava TaxID=406432 RepID=A0A562V0W1_9ACTN|nr:membrane protein insertase YidC [Stackebrandtia albiflava]TWJ11514.1 YidC/Oxa1 family membrane protein insertase [Stackebrandtia albiflava]